MARVAKIFTLMSRAAAGLQSDSCAGGPRLRTSLAGRGDKLAGSVCAECLRQRLAIEVHVSLVNEKVMVSGECALTRCSRVLRRCCNVTLNIFFVVVNYRCNDTH